jgi:3-hydroxyisobutyrate dehydrogenase-like beta-hydroxyacid dehydrogenase
MLDGAYDPGFKLSLHRKDLASALQLAREETSRCSPPPKAPS